MERSPPLPPAAWAVNSVLPMTYHPVPDIALCARITSSPRTGFGDRRDCRSCGMDFPVDIYSLRLRLVDPGVFTNRKSTGNFAILVMENRTASRCIGLMSQFLEFGTIALGTLSNAALHWRSHASPIALVIAIS